MIQIQSCNQHKNQKEEQKISGQKAAKKLISIFGSTGSIGKNAVEVIKKAPQDFEIQALIAQNDYETLANQAIALKPKFVCIANSEKFFDLKSALEGRVDCEIMTGWNSVLELAKLPCELMISAIVGSAALLPTFLAIEAGANIALANKESLVCAGEFLTAAAKKMKVSIIPIDSEHNAIFQVFEGQNLDSITDITLTASGGPFFNSDLDFSKITIDQALKHPNWRMGAKISIDSATMMNKGLEMIEAYHLFPIAKEKIKILVHPQSIIHGMVSYHDGSSLAMMSLPDMKIPITHAINFPKRSLVCDQKLDLLAIKKLEFFAVDENRFIATKLCRQALHDEGSAAIVLNASNEIAVSRFLAGEISFDKITKIVAKSLEKLNFSKAKSIAEVLEIDTASRNFAQNLSC